MTELPVISSRLPLQPRIGLTTSEIRYKEQIQQTPEGEPPQTEMALGLTYVRAIEDAGGIPMVLPPLEDGAIGPVLECVHGICLSGGPDLDPHAYGERHHPEVGPIEPEIDRFELELVRLAWESRKPILAICRGAQALNVSRGGSLIQHLPEHPGVNIQHRQTEPGAVATHPVSIEAGSLLAEVMGTTEADVNSFHHQAPARIGSGLRVVAHSPDGVVEGLEGEGEEFVLGVQWHAETLTERPEQHALFEALVDAARGSSVPARRAA